MVNNIYQLFWKDKLLKNPKTNIYLKKKKIIIIILFYFYFIFFNYYYYFFLMNKWKN